MKVKKLYVAVLLLLALAVYGCVAAPTPIPAPAPTPAPYRPSQLTLAVLPSRVPTVLYETWLPAVDYIAAEIGMPVKLANPNSYEEYIPMILDSQPEVAYITNLQYLTIHRDKGYEAIIAAFPPSVSKLIVAADSPINTINDLRGKTIALLLPSSLGGNVQMRVFLANKGLIADKDYRVVILEYMTMCVNAVTEGKVDAAAISIVHYQGMSAEQRALFRIIAETPPLPPYPFSVRGDLAPEIREKLTNTLLSMNESPEGKKIMELYGWNQMSRVDDTAYDVMREFAKKYGIEY